jgi:hypothetical protein
MHQGKQTTSNFAFLQAEWGILHEAAHRAQ